LRVLLSPMLGRRLDVEQAPVDRYV
jgi:hypothetical protein